MAKTIKKSSRASSKVKKKRWFTIVSPKILGEKPVGESYLVDPETSVGRTIKVNLMQVTGDVKNQNASVKFQISEAKENKLMTKIIGYNFSSSTIKRFVRRKMSRIDDSLVIRTKDDVLVRIKPFCLTRGKISRAVQYNMRASMKEELIGLIKETNYEDLFSNTLKYKIQKELKDKLSKVYPVRTLEIRVLKEEKHHSAREDTVLKSKKKRKIASEEKPVKAKKSPAKKESSEESESVKESKETKDSE